MSFITDHQTELEQFSQMSKTVGARADYIQGGGGNTSVKTEDGIMAIKASGFLLSDITPESAYALIDYIPLAEFFAKNEPGLFEDAEKTGSETVKALTRTIPEMPALRPSVEAGFHSILGRFVVHSHSVYANLAACAQECEEILAAAFAGAPYEYAVVPYTDPGTRLTFIIRDAIRETEKKTGKKPAIIVMKNHGIIASADTADEAVRLHEDANERIAGYFGISFSDFPKPELKETGENSFVSATPYLAEKLKGTAYTPEMLIRNPLYPDQMVFFTGTLLFTGEELHEGSCRISNADGTVRYLLGRKQAQALEETFCAVIFLHEALAKKGFHIQYMGEEARSFISSWESEKYRKSLQK